MRHGPERGKRGQVIEVIWKKNQVRVKGVNVEDREYLERESNLFKDFKWIKAQDTQARPIYYRYVAPIDPTTQKSTCKFEHNL